MDDDKIGFLKYGGAFVKVLPFGEGPECQPDYRHSTMTVDQELKCARNFYYAVENYAGVRRITSREDSLERLFDLGYYFKRTLTSREQVRNWFRGGVPPARIVEVATNSVIVDSTIEGTTGGKRGRAEKPQPTRSDSPVNKIRVLNADNI